MVYGKNYIGKDRLCKYINDSITSKPNECLQFKEWLRDVVFKSKHYMYFNDNIGYCTNCNRKILIDKKPKQLENSICPNCGEIIIYSNTKFATKWERCWISILETCWGGIVERRYSVGKSDIIDNYTDHKSNFDICTNYSAYECERRYLGRGNKEFSYEQKLYQEQCGKWIHGNCKNAYYSSYLYPYKLDKITADINYQYSAIEEYAMYAHEEINAIKYLLNVRANTIYEKLVKLGFANVTNGYYYSLNTAATEVYKSLEISKATLKQLIFKNPSCSVMKQIKEVEKIGEMLGIDYQYNDIVLFNKASSTNVINSTSIIFKYYKIKTFSAYWINQKRIRSNKNMRLRDYEDYLAWCERLDINMNDTAYLKPKVSHHAHESMQKQYLALKNIACDAKIVKRMSVFDSIDMQVGNFNIQTPTSASDLLVEGKALHHCVGTYANRVADGSSIILFIRKNKCLDESLYTLEIDPSTCKIIQCRGERNCSAPPKLMTQIKKWISDKAKPAMLANAI